MVLAYVEGWGFFRSAELTCVASAFDRVGFFSLHGTAVGWHLACSVGDSRLAALSVWP